MGNVIKTSARVVTGLLAAGLGPTRDRRRWRGAVANGCTGQTFEQPFLPPLDPMSYVLFAGGTF